MNQSHDGVDIKVDQMWFIFPHDLQSMFMIDASSLLEKLCQGADSKLVSHYQVIIVVDQSVKRCLSDSGVFGLKINESSVKRIPQDSNFPVCHLRQHMTQLVMKMAGQWEALTCIMIMQC